MTTYTRAFIREKIKLHEMKNGLSYDMANFEAFHRGIKLRIKLLFMKSGITSEDELSEPMRTNNFSALPMTYSEHVVRISEMAQEEGDNDRRQRLFN